MRDKSAKCQMTFEARFHRMTQLKSCHLSKRIKYTHQAIQVSKFFSESSIIFYFIDYPEIGNFILFLMRYWKISFLEKQRLMQLFPFFSWNFGSEFQSDSHVSNRGNAFPQFDTKFVVLRIKNFLGRLTDRACSVFLRYPWDKYFFRNVTNSVSKFGELLFLS